MTTALVIVSIVAVAALVGVYFLVKSNYRVNATARGLKADLGEAKDALLGKQSQGGPVG